MEHFRELREISEADERHAPWVIRDRTSDDHYRQKTLDDHYYAIAAIELVENAPELVQNVFTTARHLLLYSWYVYPFIVVAELQAYASLEFALKWRIVGEAPNVDRWGLRKCMEHAIEQGWLRDEGVREAAETRAAHVDFLESFGLADKERKLDESDPQAYGKLLADSFTHLRNELAHGSPMLWPGGYVTLNLVARLINQLYQDA